MPRVQFVKFGLLALAVMLAASLFLWPEREIVTRVDLRPQPAGQDLSNLDDQQVRTISTTTSLLAPRFTGRDARDRTWEITASQAQQQGTLDNEKVQLTDVAARFTDEMGADFLLRAQQGTFRRQMGELKLVGGVSVTAHNYTLHTPQMTGNVIEGRATGGPRVEIFGKRGRMVADHFEIRDNGSYIRFWGDVHLTTVLPWRQGPQMDSEG